MFIVGFKPRFFLVLLVAAGASASPLRVGLFQSELPQSFCVQSDAPLTVHPTGTAVASEEWASPVTLCFRKKDRSVVMESGDHLVTGDRFELVSSGLAQRLTITTPRRGSRVYQGRLEVRAGENELRAILQVEESAYVSSVIGQEMPGSWPLEALKSQAVLCRTYARQQRGRHEREGFDLCDTAHCQVFAGSGEVAPRAREATEVTRDEILLYRGKPAKALYHSCCGGATADNEAVWGGIAVPYLRSHPDANAGRAFCAGSPDFRWSFVVQDRELSEVGQLLRGRASSSAVTELMVDRRDAEGRALRIRLRGGDDEQIVSGDDLYLAWGKRQWHRLKSAWFEIRQAPGGLEFTGRGLGHGVGLCQWGARGRAESGKNYLSILSAYFPGCTIGPEPHSLWRRWREAFIS